MVQWMHYVFVDVIEPHVARRSMPEGVALIVKQPIGPSGHPLCVVRSLKRDAIVAWLLLNDYDSDAHPIKKRFYGIDDASSAATLRPRGRKHEATTVRRRR